MPLAELHKSAPCAMRAAILKPWMILPDEPYAILQTRTDQHVVRQDQAFGEWRAGSLWFELG